MEQSSENRGILPSEWENQTIASPDHHMCDRKSFFSGNKCIEVTKDIIHMYKTERIEKHKGLSKTLFLLSVPATPNCHGILNFVAPCHPFLQHIRIIRDGTPNQFMVLLEFRSVESAPLVRLERLNESVYEANRLIKWGDSTCPVCRCVQTPELAESSVCMEFEGTEALWICLICGHVGCGRYQGGHAASRFLTTNHTYALQLGSNRVWNYAGDNGLLHSESNGKLVATEDRFGNGDEKIDSMQLENVTEKENQSFKEKMDGSLEKFGDVEVKLQSVTKEKVHMEKKCAHVNAKITTQSNAPSHDVNHLRPGVLRLRGGSPPYIHFSKATRDRRWIIFSNAQACLREVKLSKNYPVRLSDDMPEDEFHSYDIQLQTDMLISALQLIVDYSEVGKVKKWFQLPQWSIWDIVIGTAACLFCFCVGFMKTGHYKFFSLMVVLVTIFFVTHVICRLSPKFKSLAERFVCNTTGLCVCITIGGIVHTIFSFFQNSDTK